MLKEYFRNSATYLNKMICQLGALIWFSHVASNYTRSVLVEMYGLLFCKTDFPCLIPVDLKEIDWMAPQMPTSLHSQTWWQF